MKGSNRLLRRGIACFLAVSTSAAWCDTVPSASSVVQATSTSLAEEVLAAAKLQAAIGTKYRMIYPRINYPAGDISPKEGLCCDVVIRALRAAGIDLQELVEEDLRSNRADYRGLNMGGFQQGFDKSWNHRRTAILDRFLSRHALALPTRFERATASEWRPGDIVIFKRNGNETWHVALVSDNQDPRTGEPMLIDAWMEPGRVSETHRLGRYGSVAGHYRLPTDFRERLSGEHQARAREAWTGYVEANNPPQFARVGSDAPEAEN